MQRGHYINVTFRLLHILSQILGVIENMSYYRCPQCSHEAHLFGNGGARAIASELGMDFLGGVPLALKIRETSDAGVPVAVAMRDSGVLGDMQEGGKGAPVDLCENGASVERSADDHSHDGRPSVDRAYADIADRILAKLDMTRQAGEHTEEREVETPRNSEQRQSS